MCSDIVGTNKVSYQYKDHGTHYGGYDGKDRDQELANRHLQADENALKALKSDGTLSDIQTSLMTGGSISDEDIESLITVGEKFSPSELKVAVEKGIISQDDANDLIIAQKMNQAGMSKDEIKTALSNFSNADSDTQDLYMDYLQKGSIYRMEKVQVKGWGKTDQEAEWKESRSHLFGNEVRALLLLANKDGLPDNTEAKEFITLGNYKEDGTERLFMDYPDYQNLSGTQKTALTNYIQGLTPTEPEAKGGDGTYNSQLYDLEAQLEAQYKAIPTDGDDMTDAMDAQMEIMSKLKEVRAAINGDAGAVDSGDKDAVLNLAKEVQDLKTECAQNGWGVDSTSTSDAGMTNTQYLSQLSTLKDNLQAMLDGLPAQQDGEDSKLTQHREDLKSLIGDVQGMIDNDNGVLNDQDVQDLNNVVGEAKDLMDNIVADGLGKMPGNPDLEDLLNTSSQTGEPLTLEQLRGCGIPEGMGNDIIALSFLFALNSINTQTDLFNDKVAEGNPAQAGQHPPGVDPDRLRALLKPLPPPIPDPHPMGGAARDLANRPLPRPVPPFKAPAGDAPSDPSEAAPRFPVADMAPAGMFSDAVGNRADPNAIGFHDEDVDNIDLSQFPDNDAAPPSSDRFAAQNEVHGASEDVDIGDVMQGYRNDLPEPARKRLGDIADAVERFSDVFEGDTAISGLDLSDLGRILSQAAQGGYFNPETTLQDIESERLLADSELAHRVSLRDALRDSPELNSDEIAVALGNDDVEASPDALSEQISGLQSLRDTLAEAADLLNGQHVQLSARDEQSLAELDDLGNDPLLQ